MKKITIEASSEYDILIEKGLLDRVGELSVPVTGKVKAAVVSDDTVFSLYGERVVSSLEGAGYTGITSFVIPHGEESKNLDSFTRLITYLAETGYTRSDVVFALGGGVVGDLAGFASACFLRGIRFIQIPTTLLACVDSSVGGKTAVDIPMGKNLVGAFHQPSLVLCDPTVLDTLPPETFACGMAEVIKYGMICDRPLFELLAASGDPRENIETIIEMCVKDKAAIVGEDEFDTGMRQLLNLGHTIGHGVESLSDFSVMHGEAVAIGMAIITRAAAAMGLCPTEDCQSLLGLLRRNALPTSTEYGAEDIYRKSLSDKKRKGGTITLVVPHGIADSRLISCPVETVLDYIKQGLQS
ncbi:MAG: 3-dehydroquinate synthase [Ruminococcaceae bacterium]|nr:3-dehydroquinate synthase [Oscillospiraceae bacterium]